MEVLSVFLLALLGGNTSPTAEDLKKILGLVGADVDEDRIKLLLSEVTGKSFADLIASRREKLASISFGGGGVAVATATGGGVAVAVANGGGVAVATATGGGVAVAAATGGGGAPAAAATGGGGAPAAAATGGGGAPAAAAAETKKEEKVEEKEESDGDMGFSLFD